MNYIVGISGTHGTGKSTLIKAIKADGFPVNEVQLSRAAQRALGWATLKDAISTVDSMWDLQEAILGAMYDRDLAINEFKVLTAVERTPADVWAYTEQWCIRLGIDPLLDKHAYSYRQRCFSMAHNYARIIIVPSNPSIPFEAEPNRADINSRNAVEHAIEKFVWGCNVPQHIMRETRRADREIEVRTVMVLEKFRGVNNG